VISNVATTSRQALARLSQPGKNTQGDDVFEVISKACAAGRKDLSLREIKHLYQDAFSVDIDVSTVSARVNVLVKAKRLVRDPVPRPCTLSGVLIGPVSLAPTQPDLPY
jgi:hypothetical protein